MLNRVLSPDIGLTTGGAPARLRARLSRNERTERRVTAGTRSQSFSCAFSANSTSSALGRHRLSGRGDRAERHRLTAVEGELEEADARLPVEDRVVQLEDQRDPAAGQPFDVGEVP